MSKDSTDDLSHSFQLSVFRVVGSQEFSLKLFGFLPWNASRFCRIYSSIAVIIFTLGGIFEITINALSIVWMLTVPSSKNSLVRILPYIPYCFINIRAVFVLFICWRHSDYWHIFKRSIVSILEKCSKQNLLANQLKRLRRISIAASIGACVLVIAFEFGETLHWVAQDPRRGDLNYDLPLDPLPLRLPGWCFMGIWYIFCDVLYCLSQQVYIVLILYSVLTANSLRDINAGLDAISETLAVLAKCERRDDEYLKNVYQIVRRLKARYFEIVSFCCGVNETYGWVIFIIYGMDLVTVCGFLAGIVANDEKFLSAYLINFISVLVFVGHIFLMIPMVGVYEQSSLINLKLHRIMENYQALLDTRFEQCEKALHVMPTNQMHLPSLITSFIGFVRDRPAVFSGADLFHVKRSFLAGSITFLLSCAIVLNELIQRTEELARMEQTSFANFTAQLKNYSLVADSGS